MEKDMLWALHRLNNLRVYLGVEKGCTAGAEKTKEDLDAVLPVLDEAVTVLSNIAAALVVASVEYGRSGGNVTPEFLKMTAEQVRTVLGRPNE